MLKLIYKLSLLVVGASALLLLVGCAKSQPQVEVYVLRASEIGDYYVEDPTPVLTSQDIASYDYKKHKLIVTDQCLERLNEAYLKQVSVLDPYETMSIQADGAHLLGGMYPDRFAFKVDGEVIYEGTFGPPMFVDKIPSNPFIRDTEDGFEIKMFDVGRGAKDVREDERLISALKDMDVLVY